MTSQKKDPLSTELNPSKQSIWGLNALLFFISDVRNGIGPLLAIYLRNSLGWNSAKIGAALALAEVGGFMAQIPAGLIADASKSKRSLIVVACLIIILGCWVMSLFPFLTTIMFTQLLMGISIALIPSAIGAMTLGLFGRKKLPVRISKNEMWSHAGKLFTALVAGLVSYSWGNIWIFYIVMLFGVISLCALTFIRPHEINYQAARELGKIENEAQIKELSPVAILQLLKRRPVIIFNLSLIFYYIANGAQMIMVAQILANRYPAYSALFITACLLIAEFVMIFVAYTMSKIVNRFHRKVLFLTAFLILPIRALLYTLVDNPLLLLSIQIFDGLASGILGVMTTVINSDLAIGTGRFNFLQGIGALSTSLGEAASQLTAGLVAQAYGFQISFFFLASAGLLGALFFWIGMPETKTAEAH